MGDAVALRRQRAHRRQLAAQHVARNLHEHRAGPAAHRRAERAAKQLGDALGLVNQHRVLGHRPEHAEQVVFLEGILLVVIERDPADQDDHR
jgi:hypothetical protein